MSKSREKPTPGPGPDPSEDRGGRVEHEVHVAADPERAWEAWADPAFIAGWFVERAVGRPASGEPVTWAWDRFGIEVQQEVLEADAPERLVLRAPQPGGMLTVLEVTLRGEGEGTVVRVVQSGFGEGPEGRAAREGTDTGWAMALGILRRWVDRWYGRPKTEALVMRPVAADPRDVAPWYRRPELLAEWLDPSDLDVTGPVLVDAGPERLRAWDELEGTLELKAVPAGGGRCTIGLRALSWSLPQDEMDRLEPRLAAALEALASRLEQAS